jgi:hypothetical protein
VFFLLAGFAVSAGSFMSFGNLTVLPALALYALLHFLSHGVRQWRQWLVSIFSRSVLFIMAACSVWLIYRAVSGNSFWDVFSTAMDTHLNLGRTYWIWVLLNPYEFLMFLGAPVAVLFATEGWRTWRRTCAGPWQAISPAWALTLSITGTLALLNLSGVARGEVGRIWLLWVAPACLISAFALNGPEGERLYPRTATLLAYIALMCTLFLRVSATGVPAYQPRRPRFDAPSAIQPVDARLGGQITLVGFEIPPEPVAPGDTLSVTLYWLALERTDRPYTVFAHVVDSNGALRAQQDSMPMQNSLPTTCWVTGEYVTDSYGIPLAVDMPAGEYWLEAGMYWLPSGERLSVSGRDAVDSDRVLLGPVVVQEPQR